MKKNQSIFVGNIPPHLTEKEVCRIFRKKANFRQIQLSAVSSLKDRKNDQGYAYIKCTTQQQKKLLSKRFSICGQKLALRAFLKSEYIVKVFDFSQPSKLVFIRGIPASATNDDIKKAFSQFGLVELACAIRPSKKDRSIFYGFVQYVEVAPLKVLQSTKITINGSKCESLPFTFMPNFLEHEGAVLGRTKILKPNNGHRKWLNASYEKLLDHSSSNIRMAHDITFRGYLNLRGKLEGYESHNNRRLRISGPKTQELGQVSTNLLDVLDVGNEKFDIRASFVSLNQK